MSESHATGRLGPASLDALLAGLIDYAGLFPPAGLDMQTAVANYAKYLAGPYARALGRFVLPVGRFAEFEAAFAHVDAVEPWGISALIGASTESDLVAVEKFNQRHPQSAYVDVIEVKAATSHDISHIRGFIRGTIMPYFEIPPEEPAELLSTIHHIRGRAKLRTGGVTPDAFPSPETVANFIMECAKHDVAFKATAGLHHPVRCSKPLTYEAEAPTGPMHGFLNLFLCAAACHNHPSSERLDLFIGLLNSEHREFSFDNEFASISTTLTGPSINGGWVGDPQKHGYAHTRVPIRNIRSARQNFAISFGSCSFEEPINDLKALNLL